MSYQPIDDSGEFNDSAVYLHPIRLTDHPIALTRTNNSEQLHLGIYESIKLSPLLRAKQGKVVELVTLDVPSRHAFVSEEGQALLRQFATSEVAFIMVAGNRNVGKSFFCDKILNLCEVRGNHFCRSKNTGINVWSSPFQKGDLKIFLLQISGCAINSEQFKILLTYAIMIGSAFVVIDDIKQTQHNALQEFDQVLAQIVDQITPSRLEARDKIPENRNVFLPQFFFFLRRNKQRKENQNMNIVAPIYQQQLPNALVSSYKGDESEMIHIPFLDTKCISEEYMRKVSSIFSKLHEVVTQKRYNQLNLTGSIVLKIIKYIQTYLNGSHQISIEELYEKIIEDLYQSAYNYCILSYHEEMEKHFEDEEPKSLDQLIQIFEIASNNVLEKFQEFTLDEKFHGAYQEKLDRHIDEKELMIMDINRLKTLRVIHASYDASDITDYDSYKSIIKSLNSNYPNLNHGNAEGIGRVTAEFFRKMKGVDYKTLRQIQRLSTTIQSDGQVLYDLKNSNQKKSKERSLVNKQHEELYQSQKRLQNRKKQLRTQIENTKSMSLNEPDEITKQRQHYEGMIKRNNAIISEYQRGGDSKKNKQVFAMESKIEETQRNIARLEKILLQMRTNPQPQLQAEGKKEKGKGKQKL